MQKKLYVEELRSSIWDGLKYVRFLISGTPGELQEQRSFLEEAMMDLDDFGSLFEEACFLQKDTDWSIVEMLKRDPLYGKFTHTMSILGMAGRVAYEYGDLSSCLFSLKFIAEKEEGLHFPRIGKTIPLGLERL